MTMTRRSSLASALLLVACGPKSQVEPAPIEEPAASIPSIVIEEPTVGPSYSRDLVRRVVRTHFDEIEACLATQSDPKLAGKVVIAWTIELDGKPSKARVTETTVGDEVAGCIRDAITTWEFPKPTHGALEITYPFVLSQD